MLVLSPFAPPNFLLAAEIALGKIILPPRKPPFYTRLVVNS